MLDKQDYKDIARIYNKRNYKKQMIVRAIFFMVFFLIYPIMNLWSDYYLINSLSLATTSLIGLVVLYIMEKKQLFIPREYFAKNGIRIIEIIMICWWGIEDKGFTPLKVRICSIIVIVVEICTGLREYRNFTQRMNKIQNI